MVDGTAAGAAAEEVDFVDADDRPAGRGPRGRAAELGLHYRVAATVCVDREGRVLVYRRPAHAPVFAGYHDVLIGGAVRAGETYLAAAERELAEELGVRPCPAPREIFRTRHGSPAGPCWLAVHRVTLTGPVRPDPSEIAWCELRPVAQVLGGTPGPFISAGRAAVERLFG